MVLGWVAVLVSGCRAGLMLGVGHGWGVERDRCRWRRGTVVGSRGVGDCMG